MPWSLKLGWLNLSALLAHWTLDSGPTQQQSPRVRSLFVRFDLHKRFSCV